MASLIDISSRPTIGAHLSGDTIELRGPSNDEVLAMVTLASPGDVTAATDRAVAAQKEWATTSPFERAEIFLRAASSILEYQDDFVYWGVRETGGITAKAANEVQDARGELVAAAALSTQPIGSLFPTAGPRQSYGRRVPFGVIGVITPWNFPLFLALRSVAPALVLGNAVLLKPDHQTPVLGGELILRLFTEAGLPEGVLEVVPGGPDVGAALVEEPRIPMISFTGSTATGRKVAAMAGSLTKKVSLELGGNNPLIVLEDADVTVAASIGSWGSFLHQGQICLTTGRHIVHRSIADAYVEELTRRAGKLGVGDPTTEQVALGPLINESQANKLDAIVEQSIAKGAELKLGGTRDGLYYQPTVLAGVTPDMPAFSEELFGPVAGVTVFDTDEEAVELANLGDYGLTSAVVTANPYRGQLIAERLETGMAHVNDTTVNGDPVSPFGGAGGSGNGGSYGSPSNIEEFTRWQWVTIREKASGYPF